MDRNLIANYMQQQFTEVLSKKFQITSAADSRTLRLHLTLTGIELSTPVVSALTHIDPFSLIVNSGLQVAGDKGTFLGSVTYAVDLYDVKTGKLIYATISKESAHALDITSSFGRLDATKAGVRLGAKHFVDTLTKDHLGDVASATTESTSANF
jgi:hypothetical protein